MGESVLWPLRNIQVTVIAIGFLFLHLFYPFLFSHFVYVVCSISPQCSLGGIALYVGVDLVCWWVEVSSGSLHANILEPFKSPFQVKYFPGLVQQFYV